MSFFCVSELSVGYGKNEILHDVSFCVESQNLVGILGANGSGKSTLLKAICNILPHRGTCTLEDASMESLSSRQLARLCSYIPQRSGISIDIAALDVVLMGFNPHLRLLEHPTAAMRRQALEALNLVGLHGKENQNYMTLSEGQKQLCILARTLCADSRLLILDEPESALDFRLRFQMLSILRSWIQAKQRSALVALHDPSLALNYCDKLLLISEGTVSHILHPKTDKLADMKQKLQIIYGNISLHQCVDKKGHTNLLMLKEEDYE